MQEKRQFKVGATYTTTHPLYPQVRVIDELARDVDTNGNVCGPCKGYSVCVVDGKFHMPVFVDKDGFFIDDKEYYVDERIEDIPILEKYLPKKQGK